MGDSSKMSGDDLTFIPPRDLDNSAYDSLDGIMPEQIPRDKINEAYKLTQVIHQLNSKIFEFTKRQFQNTSTFPSMKNQFITDYNAIELVVDNTKVLLELFQSGLKNIADRKGYFIWLRVSHSLMAEINDNLDPDIQIEQGNTDKSIQQLQSSDQSVEEVLNIIEETIYKNSRFESYLNKIIQNRNAQKKRKDEQSQNIIGKIFKVVSYPYKSSERDIVTDNFNQMFSLVQYITKIIVSYNCSPAFQSLMESEKKGRGFSTQSSPLYNF